MSVDALEAAFKEAAEHLPVGWIVKLCVENGAAWVELLSPDDEEIDVDTADLTLTAVIQKAISLSHDGGKTR